MKSINAAESSASNPQAINPWLPYVKPNPRADMRLFCFPYAGGAASVFRSWQELIPSRIEVCPVQLPGREGRIRDKPFSSLGLVVDAIATSLEPYWDKPFAFFGHSMGAAISFELARQLRRRYGLEPVALFVSGRSAPQLPRTKEPTFDLPEPEFIEALKRLNGTPSAVLSSQELMRLMVPLLRADFAVCETYSYEPEAPLSCPITVFGGLHDEIEREDLRAWIEQTTSFFSLRMMKGNHFFLHTEQPLLLQIISRELFELMNNRS